MNTVLDKWYVFLGMYGLFEGGISALGKGEEEEKIGYDTYKG